MTTTEPRALPAPFLLVCLLVCTSLWMAAAGAQTLPAALDAPGGNATQASAQPLRAQWSVLSPAEREAVRARYRAWRALPERERVAVRAGKARFAAQTVEEQRAARTRFDALDQLHRDGWRLGTTLGARWPQLQGLFGYVPASRREALLALLHGLDGTQLDQLTELAQRTPPQEREALRDALLAQPASARGAWLRSRLGR